MRLPPPKESILPKKWAAAGLSSHPLKWGLLPPPLLSAEEVLFPRRWFFLGGDQPIFGIPRQSNVLRQRAPKNVYQNLLEMQSAWQIKIEKNFLHSL